MSPTRFSSSDPDEYDGDWTDGPVGGAILWMVIAILASLAVILALSLIRVRP